MLVFSDLKPLKHILYSDQRNPPLIEIRSSKLTWTKIYILVYRRNLLCAVYLYYEKDQLIEWTLEISLSSQNSVISL